MLRLYWLKGSQQLVIVGKSDRANNALDYAIFTAEHYIRRSVEAYSVFHLANLNRHKLPITPYQATCYGGQINERALVDLDQPPDQSSEDS